MAATSHPLATQCALAVLREGGNAVDAAIAASATLCVVEPHMTGIGGDCFALVCEPDGTLHGLNGHGRSAAGASLDGYLDRGFTSIAGNSVHAITAPGAIRAWEELHARFGRMDFARLFADAVRHGRDGFPVAPRVASDWAGLVDKLAAHEGGRRHWLIDGRAPRLGDVMRTPALADVLEGVARNGSRAFYEGEVAADIASTVAELGGFLSEEDLAAVTVDWVEPIRAEYRGLEICEIPPSGQGLTTLILLQLLARTQLPPDPGSAERHHRQIELGRLAYGVRDAEIADPAHMRTGVDALLSPLYLDDLLKGYDPALRNPEIRLPKLPESDTIYLSVVDQDRLAVSFINSVYSGFGTGIVAKKTGIALQNRGACFVLEPGHPNAIGPLKRPMHTIIPAMAMADGKAALSFGVMGAAFQPMGQAHVLSNMLDYGMDPQEAIDEARLFWNGQGVLEAESGISADAIAGLEARGHAVTRGGPWGGAQMIVIDHTRGTLIGASDPRKDGQAAGY